jgi:predicted acylesterase/phospholipase RssA/CRP-like cAMP-binding protein
MTATARPTPADLRRAPGEAFGGLSEATIDALAASMERVDLPAGTVLVRQGDPADSLFVVLDGRLASSVAADGADGTDGGNDAGDAGAEPGAEPGPRAPEQDLGAMGPGDVIGEVAVLTGTRRTATVRSVIDSTVAVLAADDLWRLAADDPALVDRLLATSTRRLRRGQFAAYLSSLLGPIAPELLDRIEPRIEWVSLRGGEVLFRPGEPGDALYVVLAGRLRLLGPERSDRERDIDEIGRGQPIGMTSVLTGHPRQQTVVAIRDSELARIDRATLRWFTEAFPAAALPIMRELADRLERLTSVALTNDARAATFGVVAHGRVDAAAYGRMLGDTLAGHGRTLVLTSADAAAIGRAAVSRLPLHHWLEEREAAHDFIVYVADAEATPWTEQCLRQADHVVVVADATADPAPAGVEAELAGRWSAESAPRRTLLLVQPADLDEPRGTMRWLRPRTVDQHLHLRAGVPADLERVGRLLAGRGVTLALGGGGARGYAHIGVVRAMAELGIPIDMVGGTSSGAIAGAAAARGWTADRMESTMTRFRRLLDPTLPLVSVVSGGRMWRAVDASFGGGVGIEDLWLPYFCIATDLTTAAPVVHRRGPLARAVRSSVSLPGILPPVSIDGHLLIDGGLLDNLPIAVMRRLNGGSRIIAVDVSPKVDLVAGEEVGTQISGWRVLAGRIRHPRTRSTLPSIVEVLSRTVAVAGLHFEQKHEHDTADLLIQPPVAAFGTLEFGNVHVIATVSYEPALAALREWWDGQEAPA